jgi:hypothetical protein
MAFLSLRGRLFGSQAIGRRVSARFFVGLAALAFFGASAASARAPKQTQTANLLEAGEYHPCGEHCALDVTPVTAFCFRLGDQFLVGEGSSYLHEKKVEGVEEFAGGQVALRTSPHFLWITPPDGPTIRIKRGTLYERFNTPGCIALVHKPILDRAEKVRRPGHLPQDAAAVAGPGKGDYQPLFLWYECSMDSAAAVVACKRWYKNGDSDGMDFYCAHTVDGAPVKPGFLFDPLLSQDGRLRIASGALLQHDNRSRTNGVLDRPGESCR